MSLSYLSGFGNHHQTEIESGIIPANQNSPQRHPKGLYAEQISGSAFTAPRGENKFTWVYRRHPSVNHGSFEPMGSQDFSALLSSPFEKSTLSPNQMRWDPRPLCLAHEKVSFFNSLQTICGNGSTEQQFGLTVNLYSCTFESPNRYFYSADGEWVFLPDTGTLKISTEMGLMEVSPLEVAVVPRGIKFKIEIQKGPARGYLIENYGRPFRLPELGPIGANGLANPRHFQVPMASVENSNLSLSSKSELVAKMGGHFWRSEIEHSPLDVLGWSGTLYPYKYNLDYFNTIGSISFDHPDPCIFTVLTSPSELVGTANCDFVIFPPRWLVTEHTFRPPYFHRNTMSEYMGLIKGVYDAKETGGFVQGGGSLHNQFSPHGPDKGVFDKASEAQLKPQKLENTMAFMFESRYPYRVTNYSQGGLLQKDYQACWKGL
jgi:homogentisate 1,2-dioxygenase